MTHRAPQDETSNGSDWSIIRKPVKNSAARATQWAGRRTWNWNLTARQSGP